MARSNIKVTLPCPIQQVWDTVVNLEDCSWRGDLDRIEKLDQSRFVEHTKNGFSTNFTVTAFEPLSRWEFDMENDNMTGHWTGIFTEAGGGTIIDFTEEVTAKKLLMKPFVGIYLKKQQSAYVSDLKKKLGC